LCGRLLVALGTAVVLDATVVAAAIMVVLTSNVLNSPRMAMHNIQFSRNLGRNQMHQGLARLQTLDYRNNIPLPPLPHKASTCSTN
jgi:hypothetical protein